MSILSADDGARRYSFDHPQALPVHRSDRTKDRIRLVLSPELQEFLFQEADSVAVQRCSKQNPCWKFWCPYCAGRRAAKARWQLAPKVDEFEHVLSWVSSTKSEAFISGAWSSRTKVMKALLQDSWLTRRTSGWLREIHITYGPNGWHVHTHWAMFAESRSSLLQLESEVEGRWLASARRQGVDAHQRGQHGDVRDDVTGTIKYATKGNMTACTDGTTASVSCGPSTRFMMPRQAQPWWSSKRSLPMGCAVRLVPWAGRYETRSPISQNGTRARPARPRHGSARA